MISDVILRILFAGIIGAVTGIIGYIIVRQLSRGKRKAVPEESRIEILQKYSGYDQTKVKLRHSVKTVLNRPTPEILNKYDYYAYRNTETDNKDETVFSMLDFVCDNFGHTSSASLGNDHSLTGIIKSCEKNGRKTNCRGLSLILAELLRMNGIRARHITCKPYEEPFQDCHVVVDCLMPSGARIMLDPTYRLYLTDDDGKYISLPQLREGIICGKTFRPNATASYNGAGFNYDDYIEYMTKNVLRFNTNFKLNDTDSILYQVELVPKGYTIGGHLNIQYTTDPDYFWNLY